MVRTCEGGKFLEWEIWCEVTPSLRLKYSFKKKWHINTQYTLLNDKIQASDVYKYDPTSWLGGCSNVHDVPSNIVPHEPADLGGTEGENLASVVQQWPWRTLKYLCPQPCASFSGEKVSASMKSPLLSIPRRSNETIEENQT